MCMEQLHVLKCAWSSAPCAEMCMGHAQLHVHGACAVACACHQTESIAQDTDHTRSSDTKSILVHFTALKQSGR